MREVASVTSTRTSQGTILWFGGQISPPLDVTHARVGGVVSSRTSIVRLLELPAASEDSAVRRYCPSAVYVQAATSGPPIGAVEVMGGSLADFPHVRATHLTPDVVSLAVQVTVTSEEAGAGTAPNQPTWFAG